jgi:hypothetical protein
MDPHHPPPIIIDDTSDDELLVSNTYFEPPTWPRLGRDSPSLSDEDEIFLYEDTAYPEEDTDTAAEEDQV